MSGAIPTAILSDELHKAIKGRQVSAAVFTTFAFEPGFFEEEILPILFEQSFSHVPKIRLAQMEETLRSINEIAVYYDRRALVTGGASASLDVRRIPMSRRTGFFHPKVILLLVKARDESAPDALIVAVMSANLTRAGWWENVECAYIHEAVAGSRCSCRADLLDFMRWIRRDAGTGESHAALEAIRSFAHYRLEDETNRSAQGVLRTRLFTGAQSVASFLADSLRLRRDTYNLEVLSPYFDDGDHANPLIELIEAISPKETRVFLPQADDRAALCRRQYFEAVAGLPGVTWGRLPRNVMQRGKSGDETSLDRFVHAKVYRIWSRSEGREYIFVGSINLTSAAHSKASAGNLEAAVLLQVDAARAPGFWLEAIEQMPTSFRVEEKEEAEQKELPPVSLRFWWDEKRAGYFWERQAGDSPSRATLSSAGVAIHRIEPIVFAEWTALPDEVADKLAVILHGTSFIEISVDGGEAGTLLVSEEGMAHKPSLLFFLSAEEILRYWSLLSPEQREAFLSDKAYALLVKEGLSAPRHEMLNVRDSLFERFAGIFHAFARLDEHVSNAIEDGRSADAVYRLFGQKYDSLPSLIARVLDEDEKAEGADLVNRYVTLLTAKQFLGQLKRRYPDFFAEHQKQEARLRQTLKQGDRLRQQFDFAGHEEMDQFFHWFERNVLSRRAARNGRMKKIEPISIEVARQLIDFSGNSLSRSLADEQLQGAVAIHNFLARDAFAYLADEVGMGQDLRGARRRWPAAFLQSRHARALHRAA
jgi:hypothetical protein